MTAAIHLRPWASMDKSQIMRLKDYPKLPAFLKYGVPAYAETAEFMLSKSKCAGRHKDLTTSSHSEPAGEESRNLGQSEILHGACPETSRRVQKDYPV